MQSPLETLIRATVKNPKLEEIKAIEAIFTKREFRKGDVFKKRGSVSKELAFILKGSARAYLISFKGYEITSSVVQANQFFADLISVRTNEANPITLDFLEDSIALVAPMASHRKLLDENLAYNILIREHLAEEAMEFGKRHMLFLTGNAKERYQYILETNPLLIKNFPLKYIATMIGVTPTQLSRIRSEKE